MTGAWYRYLLEALSYLGNCHLEKLHNLEQPSTGFLALCFPVKIERASAGWMRAVAILHFWEWAIVQRLQSRCACLSRSERNVTPVLLRDSIITALTQKTPELLAKEIARCRDMTNKPFGVNLTFLPSFTAPPYPEYIAAIKDGGVRIVETAGRSPEQYMPALKAADIKVMNKCTSIRHSLKAEKIGCDAVSVDGFECGGHPDEDDIPNMILLPRAAEELKIPFVASGGMADARSLVAALATGAAGMNMGTRFIATKEAPVHDNVKNALVAASELDTRLIMRALRNTERVLSNDGVERLIEIERDRGRSLKIEDIHDLVAGVYPRVMIDGELNAGAWSCGTVVGLIHDIPSVKELIDRIMTDADRIIPDRLMGVVDSVQSPA